MGSLMESDAKILIVDDDQTNIKFLKEILEDDFQIKTVTSGEEALDIIYDYKPRILLLDIMLPGINGYDVCQKIREDERLSDMKIILVSAKAMISERQKGYDAGADDYITKPFDHEQLLSKIEVILTQTSE